MRVTSGVSKTATKSASVTTNNIALPTFSESGTTTKTVKITYPSGCGSTYTCTYSKDGGSSVTVTSTTASVSFTADGNVVAKVSDGTNTVSSSYTVTVERKLSIGTVKGGSITLDKSSALLSESVNITAKPTTDFTYQGATLVCENGTTKTITGTSFNMSQCNSSITVYPTWKKNDYNYGNQTYAYWTNVAYDVCSSGLFYFSELAQTRFYGVPLPDSRNIYVSNNMIDLTDYKYWVTRFDLYTQGDNVPLPNTNASYSYWKNIIDSNTTQWATQNHSTSLFADNYTDISSYNGQYYLQLHLLVNNSYWWGAWLLNTLIGETYSYANPA